MLEVRPFAASFIADAAKLFSLACDEARRALPLIQKHSDAHGFAAERLLKIADHPGCAAFDGPRLVGYMVELFTSDHFMGRPTGFTVGLFPCASTSDNRESIYQILYGEMSRSWIERGFHAHQYSLFATDEVLARTFFRLGFGMTHFQLFRDLSAPNGEVPDVEIRYMYSEESVRELDEEHHVYYPNPPLFWIPPDLVGDQDHDPIVVKQDRVALGEIEIIAAIVDQRTAAYFKLRKGTAETELFAHPGNGQIKSAYARPEYRGRGIGRALLAEAVRWAKRNNLERLCVEGESANIHGGNFWSRHFRPAEYSVRRCVDERINPSMYSRS